MYQAVLGVWLLLVSICLLVCAVNMCEVTLAVGMLGLAEFVQGMGDVTLAVGMLGVAQLAVD